jgi:acyl-CoA synthetase (NDP forming)
LGAAVHAALADDGVDAVVALFVPPLPLPAAVGAEFASALRAAAASSNKPLLSTFLGFDGVPEALAAPGPFAPMQGSIPSYPTPERAVRALARTVRHAQWRGRPTGSLPDLEGLDAARAASLAEVVLAGDPTGRELDTGETTTLLNSVGITEVASRRAVGLEQAQAAANELGFPVAVKVPGAVRVHLADANAVVEAWHSLALTETAEVTVQVMASRGIDVVLDVRADRSFGAVVSFGIGGLATELLGDRAYAAVPLTTIDAADLISAPRAAPMLSGYGGAEPVDLDALAELALRLSTLADEVPEVAEVLLQAVATPVGVHVLSALARLAPAAIRADTGPRRISGL